MYLLDLTLETPQENLALEEALLLWAEKNEAECLRLWESERYFVVMGAGSPLWTDVNVDACRDAGIPVLRRCSGGGTVVQGPGCLNYTLVLDRTRHPELETINGTNNYVLSRVAAALQDLEACGKAKVFADVIVCGISDIAVGDRKFSGNAQRRRKRFVLFHGTVLHGFDLDKISLCLGRPEKMPDYRAERSHDDFVMNVDVCAESLKEAIARQFGASAPLAAWPAAETAELARTRYADQEWICSI